MITTLAELLQEFIKANVEILNKEDVSHPTSIGDMFEGLSKNIINRSIFEGLNLKVVKNSFIAGCKTEFDVMLVEGDGEQLPFTDRYRYKPEQVIVVLSVRKNLYSKDIKEGFENLQFIVDHYDDKPMEPFMGNLFRDGFRAICQKDISAFKLKTLTEEEEFIWHTLRIEALLPVRILWGFNGFASEQNFRKSLNDYLNENITTDEKDKKGGFGPHNFPNLIICDKFSMMKQNGMPFGVPISETKWWPFYTTSSYNSIYFLLEVIWTRLSYKYKQLPMDIFGEDLKMEPTTRYIDGRIKKTGTNYGWEYNYLHLSEKTLREHIEVSQWEPALLDKPQYIVMNILCKKDIDLANDKDLEKFILSEGYSSLNDFIEKLKTTGLVYEESQKLKLLTDMCGCVMLPDGRSVAGENKSGRLSRWVYNEVEKIKKSKLSETNKV